MSDDPGTGATHRPTTITTADGERLETAWSGPDDPRAVVVLTHPHPLYGGDMGNVVPASLARSLPDHGFATVRVNFRGVGASTGTHGEGGAEIADVVATLDAAAVLDVPVFAVGYSFGADVLLATEHTALAAVVAVAPPLAVVEVDRMRAAREHIDTLVLSPAHDQFRAPDDAAAIVADWPRTSQEPIAGADHFMIGATSHLSERVVDFFDEAIAR